MFSDPRVIEFLNERFIPVAVNNTRLQRQADDEGRFLRLISWQGRYGYSFDEAQARLEDIDHGLNHQGLYVTTIEGEVLGSRNRLFPGGKLPVHGVGSDPDQFLWMLRRALANWENRKTQREALEIEDLAYRDPTFSWTGYPEDGMILHLGVRDLPRQVDTRPRGMKREAHNQDYVWFRREEVLSMVPPDVGVGDVIPFPEGLVRRLVRYHLADYVRGETSSWSSEAIRDAAMTLTVTEKTPEWVNLRLFGSAQLFEEGRWYEGACRERGLDASVLGYLRFDRRVERFVRFDVVAVGSRWGGTEYNVRQDDLEPAPIGIAMTIAGREARDCTAPHACQSRGGLERYFNA